MHSPAQAVILPLSFSPLPHWKHHFTDGRQPRAPLSLINSPGMHPWNQPVRTSLFGKGSLGKEWEGAHGVTLVCVARGSLLPSPASPLEPFPALSFSQLLPCCSCRHHSLQTELLTSCHSSHEVPGRSSCTFPSSRPSCAQEIPVPECLGLARWAEFLQEGQELHQPWSRSLQSKEEYPSLLHGLWLTLGLLSCINMEGSDGKQLLVTAGGEQLQSLQSLQSQMFLWDRSAQSQARAPQHSGSPMLLLLPGVSGGQGWDPAQNPKFHRAGKVSGALSPDSEQLSQPCRSSGRVVRETAGTDPTSPSCWGAEGSKGTAALGDEGADLGRGSCSGHSSPFPANLCPHPSPKPCSSPGAFSQSPPRKAQSSPALGGKAVIPVTF